MDWCSFFKSPPLKRWAESLQKRQSIFHRSTKIKVSHLPDGSGSHIHKSKKMTRLLSIILALAALTACNKDLIDTNIKDHFFLEHKGANMPVVVEGNTASKTFVVVLHGGPGGNAMIYNHAIKDFSEPMEEDYAMVYWDQRLSGNSTGKFSEDLITTEQFVEDLERLLDLLHFRYGDDIRIFLMGHSWGGALGTVFITKGDNQNRIKGWINVDGVHNFEAYERMVRDRLLELAPEQIAQDNHADEWRDIQDFCEGLQNQQHINSSDGLQLNSYGHVVGSYMEDDGVLAEPEVGVGAVLKFTFFSNHYPTLAAANNLMVAGTLWNLVKEDDYTPALENVQVPALYISGRYDCVVPLAMIEQAYEHHGGDDKELLIFERSGHSPMVNEPEAFVDGVKRFIEQYK